MANTALVAARRCTAMMRVSVDFMLCQYKKYVNTPKPKSPLRWIVLVLACLQLIGSYYCYDIPSAIKTQIDDYMGDPSNYEFLFSLMYTLYSAPNVILPFFGGYFVDLFGVRLCLLIFASLIAVGQVIFAFGLSIKSWPVILIGRLVFGFGGESLTVANSALLADWFKGKELAFAFGINLAIARCGSVINNIASPSLSQADGVVFASWFGAILCAGSVGAVLATLPVDKSFDKFRDSNSINTVGKDKVKSDEPENKISLRDVLSFRRLFWLLVVICILVYGCVLPFNNVASSLLLERDYFIAPPDGCHLYNTYECESTSNYPVDCPSSQWYQPPLPQNVTIPGEGYYKNYLTVDDIDCTKDAWSGTDSCTYTFCDRLNKAEKQAGVIMSIPYIISGVLAPVLGMFVDNYGYRAIIATMAPFILIIVHFTLAYSSTGPVGPLVGQGLAYSGFAAVLWPAVPLVCEQRLTGFGFGIVTAALNLGTAILPLIVAAIYNSSNHLYIPNVEILFGTLGILGFISGLMINYEDYVFNKSVLNSPQLIPTSDEIDDDDEDAELHKALLVLGDHEGSRIESGVRASDSDVYSSRAAFRSVDSTTSDSSSIGLPYSGTKK